MRRHKAKEKDKGDGIGNLRQFRVWGYGGRHALLVAAKKTCCIQFHGCLSLPKEDEAWRILNSRQAGNEIWWGAFWKVII